MSQKIDFVAAGCPNVSAPEAVQGLDLTGHIHIVTGGDGGLGKAIVEALAGAGAHVVLASHRSDKGKQMAIEISARSSGSVSFAMLDLSSLSSVRETAMALQKLPRITSIICNAGILQSFGATTDGFDSVFQIDYLGHAHLIRDLLPTLRRDHATVIHMSSVAGLFPCRGMATSPSAILNFTALAVPRCLDSKPNFHLEARPGQAGSDVHHYLFAKFMQIAHTAELARREPQLSGVYAVHPGTVREGSELLSHLPSSVDESFCASERHLMGALSNPRQDAYWPCPALPTYGATTAVLLAARHGAVSSAANGALLTNCRLAPSPIDALRTHEGAAAADAMLVRLYDWTHELLDPSPSLSPSGITGGTGVLMTLPVWATGSMVVALALICFAVGVLTERQRNSRHYPHCELSTA